MWEEIKDWLNNHGVWNLETAIEKLFSGMMFLLFFILVIMMILMFILLLLINPLAILVIVLIGFIAFIIGCFFKF